jgi:hypothetical protein
MTGIDRNIARMPEFSQPIHMQSRSTLRYCTVFPNQIVSGMVKHSWLHGPQPQSCSDIFLPSERPNIGNTHRLLPFSMNTPASLEATNTTRRLRHFADAVLSVSHLTVLALLLGKGERNVPWAFEKNANLTSETPAFPSPTNHKSEIPPSTISDLKIVPSPFPDLITVFGSLVVSHDLKRVSPCQNNLRSVNSMRLILDTKDIPPDPWSPKFRINFFSVLKFPSRSLPERLITFLDSFSNAPSPRRRGVDDEIQGFQSPN